MIMYTYYIFKKTLLISGWQSGLFYGYFPVLHIGHSVRARSYFARSDRWHYVLHNTKVVGARKFTGNLVCVFCKVMCPLLSFNGRMLKVLKVNLYI